MTVLRDNAAAVITNIGYAYTIADSESLDIIRVFIRLKKNYHISTQPYLKSFEEVPL